jgi:hypothetical protein
MVKDYKIAIDKNESMRNDLHTLILKSIMRLLEIKRMCEGYAYCCSS